MATALSNYIKTGVGLPDDEGKKRLLSCCHILYGHETAISCLAFCSELDVKVSGSVDGVICVHSVRQGIFVRAIQPKDFSRGRSVVRKLALHSKGIFVAHLDDKTLQMFTVNGVRLGSADVGENLFAMEICSGGEMLVTGGENCNVVIRTLNDLAVRCVLELTSHGPIRCIAFTPEDFSPSPQYMYIGTDDGNVTIVDRDPLQRNDDEGDDGLPLWTVHDGRSPDPNAPHWWGRERTSSRS
jgi:WD40 repeat protein